MMVKILWISPFAPYNTVGHAGGKNHNYYLKYINSKKKFDIKLLSMCNMDEFEKLDLDKYNIKNDIYCIPDKGIHRIIKEAINIESSMNPFNHYHKKVSNYIRICFHALIKRNLSDIENADIIICQWTESLLFSPLIRKYAKEGVKFVAIEEDVSYLGYQRRYAYSKNCLTKLYWKIQYIGLKRIEIDLLKKCKFVVTTNKKDLRLLKTDGLLKDKLFSMVPYYDNYVQVDRTNIDKHMLLYYGAMSRKENYNAAIWFIEKVMPLLDEKYKFVIIGNKPNKKLVKFASERVIIKGFVNNVNEYFTDCLCLVVPLMLGAGIKIKILEAMSAGVPVLTNNLGIEGIYAKAGEEYLHCTTEEEYVAGIQMLNEDTINGCILGKNAKRFIVDNFNIEKSADELIKRLENL